MKNGKETDVDCGGPDCAKCANTKACGVASDCLSGTCTGGACQPGCFDSLKNGNETDVDCGGSCAQKCADTKSCVLNSDCLNGTCMGDICFPAGSNVVTSVGKCPASGQTVNGHCYFLLPAAGAPGGNGYSWAAAQSACVAQGAHLVAYETQQEVGDLVSSALLKDTSELYWIGLFCTNADCSKDANWFWIGGASLMTSSISHSGNQNHCVRHGKSTGWAYGDQNCSNNLGAVCEIDMPK
jgi:hypothetical protein